MSKFERKKTLFVVFLFSVFSLMAQPVITSFGPYSGAAGSSVNIKGTGFSSTASNNVVRLNGVKCSVTSATTTLLKVNVPAGAVHGRFVVTNTSTNLACMSKRSFVVTNGFTGSYNISGYYAFNYNGTSHKLSTSSNGTHYDINRHPYTLADLDDDGLIDVIVANGTAIQWHENTSTTSGISFATAQTLVTSGAAGSYTASLHVLDYENDGDLDIIFRNSSTCELYTNSSMSFSKKQTISSTKSNLSEPLDFDLNGYFDFASLESAGSDYDLPYIMGSSSTTSPFAVTTVTYSTAHDNCSFSPIGNFDTIGPLDFIEGYTVNGSAQNPSTDIFTSTMSAGNTPSTSNTSITSVSTVFTGIGAEKLVADLNNDGYDDVITYGRGSQGGQLFRNDKNMTFTKSAVISSTSELQSVCAVDVNNDGWLDLLYYYANSSGNTMYLMLNSKSSTIGFGTAFAVGSAGFNGRFPMMADFDNDGYPDHIAYDYNGSALYIYENNVDTKIKVTESLTAFSDCIGSTRSIKSFTVSGANLSADPVIAAPTGYEISTASAGTYSSTITLTRTTGSISSTTIYLRSNSTTSGSYSGNITIKEGSAGSTLYTKSISGDVWAAATISGTLTACAGTTSTLTGSGTPRATNPWTSSNTSRLSISSSGVATAIAGGTFTVTYVNTNGCSATASFTVNAAPVVTGTSTVCPNSTNNLSTTSTRATTNAWVSSNTSIATVSWLGALTGVSVGTTSVVFTDNMGCQATVPVSVVSSPTITGSSSVCPGSTITLTGSGTKLSWASSSTGVATISSAGVVSGVAAGTTTITYTDNINCTATQSVTVIARPTITGTLTFDKTTTTTLTGSGTAATTNPWVSATTSVATVTSSGVVSGVSVGTSVITYTASTGCSNTATVTVSPIDFYIWSGGTGNAKSLSNWTPSNTGTGTAPANFNAPKVFHFSNSSGSTSFTSGGDWSVGGTIDLPSGATLNLTSGSTLTVSGIGELNNSGTISGSNATLDFTGSVAQTLTGSVTIGTIKSSNTAGVNLAASPMTITNGSATAGGIMKLAANATISNLTINNGTVDINGYSLTVNGSLSQNSAAANYYIQAGTSSNPKNRSKFVFAPSSAFADTVFINPGANTFRHFEIGSGTVNAAVTLGNSLAIKGGDNVSNSIGILKIKSGSKIVIPTGKSLTLKCDTMNGMLDLAGSASSMIECTGTGKFNIERDYFGKRGWKIYSHPFNSSIDLQQIADDIEVIGRTGKAEGFYSDLDTNASAYWYNYNLADSSTSTDLGWTPFTSAKGTSISGNPNLWHKHRPVIIFNPGARKGPGFNSPLTAYYRDSILSMEYTLGASIHLNDGVSQNVVTPTIPSSSKYFYITNPYTVPVKLKNITGLNSTNVEPYFYYWMQRRNATDPYNFMPAQWSANLISNGNTTRDDNICIPAFGAILVKLKSTASPVTFTIDTTSRQLSNFDYVIGGSHGVSRTNLMFMERTISRQGKGGIELSLMVNDSLMVDELLVYDAEGKTTAADGNDALKYVDNTFPNIYSNSSNRKALNLDMQDISGRLKTFDDVVEIPLSIVADYALNHKKVRLIVTEKNCELEMFFKNNKTGTFSPAGLHDGIDVVFNKSSQELLDYSLVFRKSALNNDGVIAKGISNSGMVIYPNPVLDDLIVEVASNQNIGKYELLDITGRVILVGNSKSNRVSIDVSGLRAGQYVLKTLNYSELFVKK